MSASETPTRVAILTDLSRRCAAESGSAPPPAGRLLAQASAVFAILAAELDLAGTGAAWPGVVGPHPDPAWRGLHADDVAEMVGLDRAAPLDLLRSELRSVGRLREVATEVRDRLDELSAFRREVVALLGLTPPPMAEGPSDTEILEALRWHDDLMTTRLREERDRSEARRAHLAGILAAVEPVLDTWEGEERPHRGIGTDLADALDRLASVYAALPNHPTAPGPAAAVDADQGPWVRPQDEGVTDHGAEGEATPG